MKRIVWCLVALLASALLLLPGCSDERGKPESDGNKTTVKAPQKPDPGDELDEPVDPSDVPDDLDAPEAPDVPGELDAPEEPDVPGELDAPLE